MTPSIGISERLRAEAQIERGDDGRIISASVSGVIPAAKLMHEAADEIDRLREALKPFAKIAEVMGNEPPQGTGDLLHAWMLTNGSAELRVSDCVRARSALSNPKGDRHG